MEAEKIDDKRIEAEKALAAKKAEEEAMTAKKGRGVYDIEADDGQDKQ